MKFRDIDSTDSILERTKKRAQVNVIDCIDNLDFEKIRTVMEALDWAWLDIGIPTEHDMIETIYGVFEFCIRNVDVTVNSDKYNHLNGYDMISEAATGGFHVSILKNASVHVQFVVTEWISDLAVNSGGRGE